LINFKTKHRLILLFILAVIFELIWLFIFYQKHGLMPYLRASDAMEYEQIAVNIIHHGTFSLSSYAPFEPSNWRTPIYPLWLAFIYLLSKSFIPAIFIGIFVFSFTSPLTYLIGREIFNEKIAWFSSILVIFEPYSTFRAGFLLTEQIFVPLFLATTYFFVRYLKCESNKYLYFLAGLCAIDTLTKPVVIYLFPILIIFIIFFKKRFKFLLLKPVILATIIFIIILAPWIIRNKLALNTWQVSSSQGTALYIYKFGALQYYLGKSKEIMSSYEDVSKLIGGSDNRTQIASDILTQAATEGIKKNPIDFIKISAFSLPDFFIRNSYGNIAYDLGLKDYKLQNKFLLLFESRDFKGIFTAFKNLTFGDYALLFSAAIWPLILLLGLMGVFVLLKEFSLSKSAIFSFIIIFLYFDIITSLINDLPRYRLPVQPLLFMFTVAALFFLINKTKKIFLN